MALAARGARETEAGAFEPLEDAELAEALRRKGRRIQFQAILGAGVIAAGVLAVLRS